MSHEKGTFPTRLLGPIVEAAIQRHNVKDVEMFSAVGKPLGGVEVVANLTGIDVRSLLAIRNRDQANVMFETADRLIIGLDLWELPGLSVAEGGLQEYYDGTLPPDSLTPRQEYIKLRTNAKRFARKHGISSWVHTAINMRQANTPEARAEAKARVKLRKYKTERRRIRSQRLKAAVAA